MSFENMDAYYAMREKIDQIKEIAQNTVLHGVPTGYRKNARKPKEKPSTRNLKCANLQNQKNTSAIC